VQANYTDLFLNHLGKYTNDCPKFVAMTQEERRKICVDAKICFCCLSHTVNFSQARLDNCKRKKQAKSGNRTEFACQVAYCTLSIWAGTKHNNDPANASTFKKKKDKIAKRGWTMGMVTIVAKPASLHHTPTTAQLDSFNSVQTDSEELRVEELVSNAEKNGTRVIAEPQGRIVLG
jgi:hypothetical protein